MLTRHMISKGTSAQILETQTAGFRALLPEHYEYHFCDGEEPFESYPAISNIFPGPYFCYYKDNTMKSVMLAHEYIREVIEDEGNAFPIFSFPGPPFPPFPFQGIFDKGGVELRKEPSVLRNRPTDVFLFLQDHLMPSSDSARLVLSRQRFCGASLISGIFGFQGAALAASGTKTSNLMHHVPSSGVDCITSNPISPNRTPPCASPLPLRRLHLR